MADVMSVAKRSALMSRIRGTDTKPELVLRKEIWKRGLRYRLNYRIGRTRPDMVFVGSRVVVFVDGCFWHQCPLHGVMPKDNSGFWKIKLARNVQRDEEANRTLASAGWKVLRFWEHQVDGLPDKCATRIEKIVRRRLQKNNRCVTPRRGNARLIDKLDSKIRQPQ